MTHDELPGKLTIPVNLLPRDLVTLYEFMQEKRAELQAMEQRLHNEIRTRLMEPSCPGD